jgi:capsid protein
LLEAWKFYYKRRAWLAQGFCEPVYELWMDEAVSIGRVAAPGYFDDPLMRRAYLGAIWVGDGPISLDPGKDIAAAKERIAVGVSTLQKESALHDGGDWKSNLEQLGAERRMRKAQGLDEAPAAERIQAEPVQPVPAESDDTTDDDNDDETPESERQPKNTLNAS